MRLEALIVKNYLYRANVYYVENYYYGSLIYYMPPVSKWNGYKFGGWYADKECTHRWFFSSQKLPLLEENQDYNETKLFAKCEEVSKENKKKLLFQYKILS